MAIQAMTIDEAPNPSRELRALRGAITSAENSSEAIEAAVVDLIGQLLKRNELIPERIISITFSVTADLNACFPASIVRRQSGWDQVAFLDCQQMAVEGDLKRCIRMLAYAWLPSDHLPKHPYLGEASVLRPDR